MLKQVICAVLVLGSSGFLLLGADNPFVGTWRMNMAKSSHMQFGPDGKLINKSEIKESITTVTVEGGTTTVRGQDTISGKSVPSVFTVPTAGGPLNYTEGAPPPEITITMKAINDRTDEFVSMMNGKPVVTTRATVSADRKRMIVRVSGVDDKGKAFKTVQVCDRQ